MKVCIIGGTGTLSTPLTKILIANDNVDLTVINRGNNLSKIGTEGYTHWVADISNEKLMTDLLEGASFDVVLNFVNYLPEEVERDIRYFSGKTKQYIFISTNVVLNHHDHVEIFETTEVGNRISVYGQNKAKCEAVLEAHPEFTYTIVRPSHTYSDDRLPIAIKGKNSWTVVDRLRNKLEILVHDGGQSVWPITHADDFARLLASLVGNEKAYNEIYHIMNPTPITWDMMFSEIARQTEGSYKPIYISSDILAQSEHYDFKGDIVGDKKYSNLFNVDKILALNPGFEFEVDLQKGVRKYLEYMRENSHLRIVEDDFNYWTDTVIGQVKAFKSKIKI